MYKYGQHDMTSKRVIRQKVEEIIALIYVGIVIRKLIKIQNKYKSLKTKNVNIKDLAYLILTTLFGPS